MEMKPKLGHLRYELCCVVCLLMLGMKMMKMGVGASWIWRRRWLSRECHLSASADDGKWVRLPPVSSSVKMTSAVKWVIRCCPNIPKTLVHKLFRLRQVRMLPPSASSVQDRFKKVGAKDTLNCGDRIFLPNSVKESPKDECKHDDVVTAKEKEFIRSLVIYKDAAILVLNKPPGMAVQGGINIKRSLDVIAAASLKYEYSEPPRLVHRLDRDSSGILLMGRTQTTAALLHSIFRDKTTSMASSSSSQNRTRILQRTYWALVIGSPTRSKGFITAPLRKVLLHNGKSDRITILDHSTLLSSQHAVTQYRVLGSSSNGFTWLELSPLTGRKHQLRVHCAEVLGTPIVGDYKYGWQAHKKWGHFDVEDSSEEQLFKEETLPFGLNLTKGSISDKQPRLHLHCKQIVLPNISQALKNVESASNYDLSGVETLDLKVDLPPYMQRSWDVTNS